ncbi:hypothetical protein K504DRAFT_38383 [Pleomassaria siparia CBS 279.74]|uniref:Uncharacterized protein n=1 Tax=Pleomassaria siparia CBS 279.74 TaxID=1314801 RepID=A0A6G1K475_9PLEO|nr:hypothetical protein K504DRAFT_38383 [Pleomassaria siparia CBS 279.74]
MDEILVHVSAPATRQNDEMYRSLAGAYAEFKAYEHNGDQELRIAPTPDVPSSLVFGEPTGALVDVSMINGSRDIYGSFPSQLSSVDDYGKSLDRSNNQHSFKQSVEPDSLLPTNRLGQLERVQAHWRQQAGPRSSAFNEQRATFRSSLSSANPDTTFIEDSQLAAQAIESQLYDNNRGSTTSEDTSDDESSAGIRSGPSYLHIVGDPLHVSPKLPAPTEADQAPSSVAGLEFTLHSFRSVTNDTQNSFGHANAIVESLNFSILPYEIFSPAPKVSVESPGTLPSQITPHLGAIQKQNPKRFKPARVSRTLGVDERGHWLVETENWSPKVQYDFWLSLSSHVRAGELGWGVNLYRDPPDIPKASQAALQLGSVRLYCWGEVVEHTWLSLWLCSKGKVSGSGLRWFDAADNVVIRVP